MIDQRAFHIRSQAERAVFGYIEGSTTHAAATPRTGNSPPPNTNADTSRRSSITLLELAVEDKMLETNPLDGVKWTPPDTVEEVDPRTYTDSGEAHDDRGLKHRPEKDTRPVPIPPALVTILRERIEKYGLADDGRLSATSKGGLYTALAISRFWKEVRALAATAYRLRHAAVFAVAGGRRPRYRGREARGGTASRCSSAPTPSASMGRHTKRIERS
ncbi:hypothetical protein AB0B89_18415 [Sphaerisporangium sp. NPDC049002]|uniref:hypothetical protein n=1 Tax=unclassified Sphaerisporangium TaxID=2630420 RepID=UPI0033F6FC05